MAVGEPRHLAEEAGFCCCDDLLSYKRGNLPQGKQWPPPFCWASPAGGLKGGPLLALPPCQEVGGGRLEDQASWAVYTLTCRGRCPESLYIYHLHT